MTYKLKDYLLEDKEYAGSEMSSGEKGILIYAIPELFVPIKAGNIGTHNAIFNSNLTVSGKKPQNIHVGINYIPFMVLNNEQELDRLKKAIKNHNPDSGNENAILKGLILTTKN